MAMYRDHTVLLDDVDYYVDKMVKLLKKKSKNKKDENKGLTLETLSRELDLSESNTFRLISLLLMRRIVKYDQKFNFVFLEE